MATDQNNGIQMQTPGRLRRCVLAGVIMISCSAMLFWNRHSRYVGLPIPHGTICYCLWKQGETNYVVKKLIYKGHHFDGEHFTILYPDIDNDLLLGGNIVVFPETNAIPEWYSTGGSPRTTAPPPK